MITNYRLIFLILISLSATVVAEEPISVRPSSWAQPVELQGVPNLYKVSDRLYRSAQPEDDGIDNLKQLGIATVVNLRRTNQEQDRVEAQSIRYEQIPMSAWFPDRDKAVRFLRMANDPAQAPILLHCRRGSDRTGAMIALYRIAVEDWSKQEAIQEMIDGGYGFNMRWKNQIEWIEQLDINSLRKEAGIQPNK